ncbi:hypothetical protein DFQ28_008984 [Apophysomyces sp. BC1034]|nr:hypothetical protein DFQ28_008984 [Apophysomyces sp. BC1034]
MDALLIFEACRRGILPKISRRLQERERGTVQSGTIFVFDERESGIKRWTDGLSWSPSRILGNFLVYRETGNRVSSQQNDYNVTGPLEPESEPALVDQVDRCRERALVGSLTSSYKFKPHGLIKKTLSIVVNGSPLHLVSYYTKEDALHQVLPAPSSVPKLACLTIAPELVLRQSFRVPPLIDPSQPEPLTSAHALTTNGKALISFIFFFFSADHKCFSNWSSSPTLRHLARYTRETSQKITKDRSFVGLVSRYCGPQRWTGVPLEKQVQRCSSRNAAYPSPRGALYSWNQWVIPLASPSITVYHENQSGVLEV